MVIYSDFPLFAVLRGFYNNNPNLPRLSRVCPFLIRMLHLGRLWQRGWGGGEGMKVPQDSGAWAGGRVSRTLRLSWDPTAGEEPLQRTAEGVPLPFCWGRFLPAPSSALLFQGASTWPGAPQLHIISCHSPLPLPLAVSRHCAGSHRPLNRMNK